MGMKPRPKTGKTALWMSRDKNKNRPSTIQLWRSKPFREVLEGEDVEFDSDHSYVGVIRIDARCGPLIRMGETKLIEISWVEKQH